MLIDGVCALLVCFLHIPPAFRSFRSESARLEQHPVH